MSALRDGPMTAFDVCRVTGIRAGTMYVDLARLEDEGRVEGEWVPVQDPRPGAPPVRRYYRRPVRGR